MSTSASSATPGRPGEVLVDIRGLSKRFGATQALGGVDVQIRAGSTLALLGHNGAGKSTLIKILAGVYSKDAGEITVCGQPLEGGAPPADTVAFIHQDLGLVDGLTVTENIALGTGYPRHLGKLIDWTASRRRAERALELVGADIDPRARVADLSRTEKSMLAIGRALVVDARVLVLDEPTASLPVNETHRLFEVLRRLRADGLGLVYVSHRLDEVFEICDRATIMRDGLVVADLEVAQTNPSEVIELIIGSKPIPPPPPTNRGRNDVLIELRDVVGDRVGPVSLAARAGEVVGMVGLAGAGQEEIGRTIAGAAALYDGTLSLAGEPFVPSDVYTAVSRGVGFVTSNRADEGLAMPLSVTENLFPNPALHGKTGLSYMAHAPERAKADELVVQFGVKPPDASLAVEGLSGGNQQKVIIGRWLSTEARVLVLEEPTAGVDVGAKREIYALLDEALERGISVLLVSTDFEEVAAVCHRALVFRDGQIVAQIDREDLTVPSLVAVATGAAA
ncbi:MAG: sugar ABC transporter ATP-binding protein [Micropruina sp.]|uniref:sugar ABC transporter ATP-binding protein n=1 Tax=Micropruina sp. TaxID=2737536 RepID=UPI0039E3B4B8